MAGLKGKWAMMAVLAVLCLSTPCTATQSTPVEQEEHAHVEDEPTDSSSSATGLTMSTGAFWEDMLLSADRAREAA